MDYPKGQSNDYLVVRPKEIGFILPNLLCIFHAIFLGKLTTDQIKAGYEALKRIDTCIRNSDFGSKLVKACDEFYTRIPHCFG